MDLNTAEEELQKAKNLIDNGQYHQAMINLRRIINRYKKRINSGAGYRSQDKRICNSK